MNKTDVIEKIYLEYREKVFRYVRGKVASTADAEDVTSEIFWRVLSSLGSYDEEKATLSTVGVGDTVQITSGETCYSCGNNIGIVSKKHSRGYCIKCKECKKQICDLGDCTFIVIG